MLLYIWMICWSIFTPSMQLIVDYLFYAPIGLFHIHINFYKPELISLSTFLFRTMLGYSGYVCITTI